MSKSSLTRDEAIRRLQTIESEIRGLGVRRLALFGSVLRSEARSDSDVDVHVEFAPTEKTFDRFMALADLLEDTLEYRVEWNPLVPTESLSPFIGPHTWPRQRMSFEPGIRPFVPAHSARSAQAPCLAHVERRPGSRRGSQDHRTHGEVAMVFEKHGSFDFCASAPVSRSFFPCL